ncbi:MAG TPA: hypothetical protein VIF10_10485 [Methylobacter sp.]|jgi:hypothetical protein
MIYNDVITFKKSGVEHILDSFKVLMGDGSNQIDSFTQTYAIENVAAFLAIIENKIENKNCDPKSTTVKDRAAYYVNELNKIITPAYIDYEFKERDEPDPEPYLEKEVLKYMIG